MNDDAPILTLSQVAQAVERTIQRDYPYSFLVRAEISKLNVYKYTGHCYPDLVEKKDGKVVAQMRAMIWERDYQRINKAFLDVLHEPLGEGIEVQCRARLVFDCSRGLALVISDIDPTVSLGNMEREKRLCIERLKKEGLFDLNKKRTLPLLPLRIAIISAATSKGYGDFISTLENDTHRFRFSTQLFVSLLQGDKASREIRNTLDSIAQRKDDFDCVAIIRGGGGDVGLGCYNDYDLCHAIATYPLPVLTGIGHSTNSTIVEEISYQNFITPTALANFFLQRWEGFLASILDLQRQITRRAQGMLDGQRKELDYMLRALSTLCHSHLQRQQTALLAYNQMLKSTVKGSIAHARADLLRHQGQLAAMPQRLVEASRKDLAAIAKLVDAYSPQRTLERGYSITRRNGKAVKDPAQLAHGDQIATTLASGEIISIVV